MSHKIKKEKFLHVLIMTYETIISIIKANGKSGIVTQKRLETFTKAINTVKKFIGTDALTTLKPLELELTPKPRQIMVDLWINGKVVLDSKEPYFGIVIENGKIIDSLNGSTQKDVESFNNLNVLSNIGIGVGNAAVNELVGMGYSSIEELKTEYKKNKFENFRKGLKIPLTRYFESYNAKENKMTRQQATIWKNAIDEVINLFGVKTFSIAGSYARNKQMIGDIDYILLIDGAIKLYNKMNLILENLTSTKFLESMDCKAFTIQNRPTYSPAVVPLKYSTTIKIWFIKNNNEKVKIEIYGYNMPDIKFFFPYYARVVEAARQKYVKYQFSKKGLTLSPFGIFKKGTDKEIELDQTIDETLFDLLQQEKESLGI